MDLQLAGTTALVTGASRGIGFAIAQGLAREGCHLHLAARYKGNSQALSALLSGEITIAGTALPSAMPYIPSGRLRPIALTSARRSAAVPQVPTLAESGAPGYEYASDFGLLLPARVPADIVMKLHSEITKALKAPDVVEKLSAHGYEIAGVGPEDYAAKIRSDLAKWSKVIRAANIKSQ